jgi:hypothetical protein
VTATPTAVTGEVNCGDWTFPLLNCNLVGQAGPTAGDHWSTAFYDGSNTGCDGWWYGGSGLALAQWCDGGETGDISQQVVMPYAGTVYVVISNWSRLGSTGVNLYLDGSAAVTDLPGNGTYPLGHVAAGAHDFELGSATPNFESFQISSIYAVLDAATPTPTNTAPATSIASPTSTPTAT